MSFDLKTSSVYGKMTDAAKMFLQRAKSPTEFLHVSTYQLHRLCQHYGTVTGYDHKKDQSYTLVYLIQEVIPVWYAGGDNLVEEITEAFHRVINYCGGEGLGEAAGHVMAAYGTQMVLYTGVDSEDTKELILFANLLLDMSEILEECGDVIREERRASAE